MSTNPIISREYKLVVRAAKFTGNEQEVVEKAIIFWNSLREAISSLVRICVGRLDTITAKRDIRFFDTKDFFLKHKNYIFRERKNAGTIKREATLKFRHPDRYVSQDRDMKSKGNRGQTKFEEDLKAPFLKLYSHSTTSAIGPKSEVKELAQITNLFPGLAKEVREFSGNENIILVNDLAILEIVITGGFIPVSFDPLIYAECALIIWYDLHSLKSDPVIAEFSFRYGDKKERYNRKIAETGYNLFQLIQAKMKTWIDSEGGTKTGFVYDQ